MAFRQGVEGSPVTVLIAHKADGCGVSIHVSGLPVFDHREALRASTRIGPAIHTDYDES